MPLKSALTSFEATVSIEKVELTFQQKKLGCAWKKIKRY